MSNFVLFRNWRVPLPNGLDINVCFFDESKYFFWWYKDIVRLFFISHSMTILYIDLRNKNEVLILLWENNKCESVTWPGIIIGHQIISMAIISVKTWWDVVNYSCIIGLDQLNRRESTDCFAQCERSHFLAW